MPESSLKVFEMQVCNTQTESSEISIDVNLDLNTVDGIAPGYSRMEEATSNFIGEVTAIEEEAYFVTGSSYKGSWDALGMAGVGRYVMPNGAFYEGEIRDGMFHGHGTLYWSENRRLDVVHLRGELQEHKYTFADSLPYREVDWSYCKFPDRRFYESTKKGLRPGGRSLKTATQPTKVLPFDCYDTGDGFFDPKTLCITSHDDSSKVLRIPTKEECDWIVKNCRKGWSEPTGYRDTLNENWSDDPPELPYNLAMSKDSPDTWWKRLTTFARDFVDDGKEKDVSSRDEFLELSKLCACGQYVFLGQSCNCTPVSVSSETELQDNSSGRRFHSEESNEYHEDNEVKCVDVFLESNSFSYGVDSLVHVAGEKKIEGIEALSNDVIQIDDSFSQKFPLHFSKELPQNLSSEKFVENYRELERKSEDKVEDKQLLLDVARTTTEDESIKREYTIEQTELQIEKKFPGMIAKSKIAVEEEIPRQYSNINHEKDTGKPEVSIEDDMLQKSTIESEERNERLEDSMKEEMLKKSSEEMHQVKIKSSDKSHKVQIGRPEDMEEKPNTDEINTNEKAEVLTIQRETQLENHDYATVVKISREKVPEDIEPETTNGHRTETKLLTKANATKEYHDKDSEDIGSIELEKEMSVKEDVSDTCVSWEDKSSKIASKPQLAVDNNEIFKKESKTSVKSTSKKSSEISKMSGLASQDLIIEESRVLLTEEATFTPNKFDENSVSAPLIYDKKKSLNLLIATRKEALSTDNCEVKTSEKSFTSSKNERRSLEKVHPSLAKLSSLKLKPSNEKEIIEIYNKFPKKEKPKNKCSNVNVWHLSSALKDYGSQAKTPCLSCGLQRKTNTEDRRSGLAMTAPRSRPIEYGRRKPCDLWIRKPTAHQAPSIASPCHEEYKFKIPTKPERLTVKQDFRNIREKKKMKHF